MKFKEFLNENSIIAKGNNLDPNFWSNFKAILKNSDQISELLDVPRQKVVSWHNKIQTAIEKNKDNKINYKSRVIKTGKLI